MIEIESKYRPKHKRKPMAWMNRKGIRLEVFEGPDLFLSPFGKGWREYKEGDM